MNHRKSERQGEPIAHHQDPYAPAVDRANTWLAAVADAIGAKDRAFTYRVVRAWLRTVRDRLGIEGAAHFSAQLPELLRGVFFEAWTPYRAPIDHRVDAFVQQFAAIAVVETTEVPALAGAVTDALDRLFSPGQIERVYAAFPRSLCRVLAGGAPSRPLPKRSPKTCSCSGSRNSNSRHIDHAGSGEVTFGTSQR